jgi:alpha-L-fucosidase
MTRRRPIQTRFMMLLLLCATTLASSAQLNSFPESYRISQKDIERARKVIATPLKEEPTFPNPHHEAQWFPDASLGLFMHWGIHSVVGAQPSWDMISHYRYGGKVAPPDRYYALADQFDPQKYDPDKWLKAAKEAGFTYAVLTTKHHDGYALWPSRYGIGTSQYIQGRDLIREYVDACRKNGMKVGFYFSPRDWHFPGLMHPVEFDANTRHQVPAITDSVANYQLYERFLAFVLAQMEEILTRYGKIDILWLDGMYFRGVSDMHTNQIYAWIRSLQPGIVVNDRWSNIVNPDDPDGTGMRIGDFTTPFECILPSYIPSRWWEHCDIWTSGGGGWGHDKTGKFRPYAWFFEHLVASRSLGGNFLPNVGPDGNGEMHPNYYRNMEAIAAWMSHSRESVIGAGPSPGVERSNVMITTRGNNWYLHLLPSFQKQVSLRTDREPISATLLRTGEPIPYIYMDGFINFTLSPKLRTEMDDVVKVVVPSEENVMTVASYNIKYESKADYEDGNGWEKRKAPLAKLILDHGIDIVGTQEGTPKQLNELKTLLSDYQYIAYPYGGSDGKLHNCATYYRADRLELLDDGLFWLSETPEKHSIGWDATDTRICQWLKFREVKSGKVFFLFNAHFYYRNEKARERSADLVISKIEEIAKNNPVIFMGDLNSTPDMVQIQKLRSVLTDCSLVAPQVAGPRATYMGGRFHGKSEMQLDYIFINDKFQVSAFRTITDTYNGERYPSDHLPVAAKLSIK